MTDPAANAPRTVHDHEGHTYWCEVQQVDEHRSRVRLMRSWAQFDPDIRWSSKPMSHADAAAKVEATMAKLAAQHEGWVRG